MIKPTLCDAKLPETMIVIGGQYGSEGKGAIVRWLTDPEQWDGPGLCIRTGGPQAGHSIKYDGQVWKMQQVPCAWPNPDFMLAMGPGSLVEPAVVEREIGWANQYEEGRFASRFLIDEHAALVLTEHQDREAADLVGRIGSTGEGVGAAQADRVMRIGKLVKDAVGGPLTEYIGSCEDLVHAHHRAGNGTIIETTQGYGLSLTRSGLYPKTTSRDITPAQVLNDAAIPSQWPHYTLMVLRTYPIRVAGPSGPFGGQETTWEALAARTGGYVTPEQTTVTKKTRRVAEWDSVEVKKAIRACQPDAIVLTFGDYWWPDLAGQTELHADAEATILSLEKELGVPIPLVSVGFQDIIQRAPLY